MGWSSGKRVIIPIIKVVKLNVTGKRAKNEIYRTLITSFEDADWDNIDEVLGIDPDFDKAAEELHPELLEIEDDD